MKLRIKLISTTDPQTDAVCLCGAPLSTDGTCSVPGCVCSPEPDPLREARGIITGCLIGLLFWAALWALYILAR